MEWTNICYTAVHDHCMYVLVMTHDHTVKHMTSTLNRIQNKLSSNQIPNINNEIPPLPRIMITATAKLSIVAVCVNHHSIFYSFKWKKSCGIVGMILLSSTRVAWSRTSALNKEEEVWHVRTEIVNCVGRWKSSWSWQWRWFHKTIYQKR